MSDSSDEEKFDGNTTPHGPAARRKTHQGGNSKGTCTQRSVSPPVTVNQPPVNQPPVNQPPAISPMDKKTFQNGRSLATGQMGITQFSSQSITGHRPSSHWSLENINTGEVNIHPPLVTGHQNLYQPTFSEIYAMGMEFTNNNNNSKKSFITPGSQCCNRTV